jgi:predicted nucleotidyltransferase
LDIQKVKENLEKRRAARERARMERFHLATKDFDRIVRMIIEKYRPRRIVQWGSLLHPDHFDEHSDIDIATEGILDAETWFALLGDAMELTRFPLDIVQLEKIEPEFAAQILRKGKVVYESER